MKFLVVALIAVVLAMLAAVAVLTHHRGSQGGEVVLQERPVAGFNRIEIHGMADVKLVQGPAESLTIEAPEGALSGIRSKVSGHTLAISTAQERRWWESVGKGRTMRSPRITISVRELQRFEGSGAVKVVADNLRADELAFDLSGACSVKIGDLQVARLRFDGSGATKAELGGKATRQEVDLSGAGVYQAAELVSETATVDVSGAGKAVINASSRLRVDLSGAGLVEYLGDPKLEQRISGVGKIRRR